jgi:hypothetical protein
MACDRYCNNVLWPLFHYVPLPLEARLAETKSLQNQWKAYVQTNHLYRKSIMELYEEGDVVWAHDYHLLLLPKLLKELKPNMKVRDTERLLGAISACKQCTLSDVFPLLSGGLVSAYAFPELGDIPSAAQARGDSSRRAQGRSDRLPHVRLRAPLHVGVHAHPGTGRHAGGGGGQRPGE